METFEEATWKYKRLRIGKRSKEDHRQGAQLQTSERSSNNVYDARLLKRSSVLKSVYKDLPIVELEFSLKGVWN